MLDGELELLEGLRSRIAESDALVKELAAGDARVDWGRTTPGFGPFFSVLVGQEIGDIRRFAGPEKLWAYTGLVPSVYASGGKVVHGRLYHRATLLEGRLTPSEAGPAAAGAGSGRAGPTRGPLSRLCSAPAGARAGGRGRQARLRVAAGGP